MKASRFHIERVRLNRGGYSDAGRYFGVGAPVFEVFDKEANEYGAVRARDKKAALAEAEFAIERHGSIRYIHFGKLNFA